MRLLISAGMFALAAASVVGAQDGPAIDRQLAGGLDFRDLKFSVCFGRSVCEVDRYRIIAWHRESGAESWHPAVLYWDPVDGLGIQGGGQDDEIDYNERLIVEFPFQRNVHGVWLTDLFMGEGSRYDLAADDDAGRAAETAGIEMRLRGSAPAARLLSGDRSLPPRPFNAVVAPEIFTVRGDLRQRLIIRDGTVSILSAAVNADGGRAVVTSVPVGQLDDDKKSLFLGEDGVTVDLTALLGEALEVTLEPEGSRNADRISALLDDRIRLNRLHDDAVASRSIGDISNGEVAGTWAADIPATSVMFHAPEGSSNDFSVAGILFAGGPQ